MDEGRTAIRDIDRVAEHSDDGRKAVAHDVSGAKQTADRRAHGRYRLRDAVDIDGQLVTCPRPLVATRLNETATAILADLSTSTFRSVEDVAAETGVPPAKVASLFEALRRRGLLEWMVERNESYRPPVSVVITVRNEAGTVEGCLDALETLSYPEYEVVVVNDGSTDGTRTAVRSHALAEAGIARLISVDKDEPLGIGASRNRGVDAARHDVVAFTDADCRPRSDWLADLVPCLVAHDVVGGRIRPVGEGGASAYEAHHSSLDMGPRAAPVDRESETPYLATANLVGRREVFEEVRFPQRSIAEDVGVCWRALQAGYDVVYTPDGVVEHEYGDANDFVSRRVAYGSSEGLLAREYGHPGSVIVPVSVLLSAVLLPFGVGLGSVIGLAGVAKFAPAAIGFGAALAVGEHGTVTTLVSGTELGVREGVVGLLRGSLSRLYAIASEVRRYYTLPTAVIAAFVGVAGFRSLTVVLVAVLTFAFCLPPLVEYVVQRPSLSLVEYVGWATADDLAYQFGAYRGALRYRTVEHLDIRRRFAVTI